MFYKKKQQLLLTVLKKPLVAQERHPVNVSRKLTPAEQNYFRGVILFIPPKLRHLILTKAHETDPRTTATEASVWIKTWLPGITQDLQHFVSKCKNCQLNRLSLGKTVFTWPEADVWERLHMDWAYFKDQGKIIGIIDAVSGWLEAFPAENRTSETVKVYLHQIFARFGIP